MVPADASTGTPWAVLNFETGELECQRCGRTMRIDLPVSVNFFADVAKLFSREHARCCRTV